ncbi:acetoacetate--CoA ligase [Thalassotalea psychrophila]|uniref:Acetoacetate--CoA ligase n=1 Tax=Thalassotalea psychrophila TaxID=3065647 RepID=A0ABY9U076_9GAMM|nr:acetoacetate--CoA ligase [Colwelliaceae bacterium SQ149]
MAVSEGELLWTPSQEFSDNSNVSKYIAWLKEKNIVHAADYQELWQWSVDNIEAFWASLWDYFEIQSDTPYTQITDSLEMKPGNSWFIGSKVNLAEHILRNEREGAIALHHLSEIRKQDQMSWTELASKVRVLATEMRARGLKPGDAVCCLMPNITETVVAMLATISIGCVWSIAAPEFGRKTILDRFTQIKPKWLFVADGYQFGGKQFNRDEETIAIVDALSDSLEQVVHLSYLDSDAKSPVDAIAYQSLFTAQDIGRDNFKFERVAHDHPVWVLFSSGTTGLPKAIVHSHVGALMGMLPCMFFHMNLKHDDTSFFYTTTGWVMFILEVSMMLSGCAAVLYDGNPAYPTIDVLWKMAAETKTTFFGASPTYVQLLENHGVKPKELHDLSHLNSILVGGAPSTPETFKWFYTDVKEDLWVTSQSGGTEIVGGFVGATPTQPVYAGEIQCRVLGMDVDSLDEKGNSLVGDVGELVCKKPFPNMPVYFLNDEGNQRYNESYFESYDGLWTHGDFIKINERGGAYITGRSDSTLNRFGVRIGTAELYRTVEKMPEIIDSLVMCIELPGGEFFMPMFLQLADGVELTQELEKTISKLLRTDCSPRHVPDKYYAIPEVPYTLTGKKLEIPVRKVLLGWPLEKAASRESMKNPKAIDFFLNYVKTTTDYVIPQKKAS